MFALAMSIPSLITRFVGITVDTTALDAVAAGTGALDSVAEDVAELQDVVETLGEVAGVTEGLSSLASDYFWVVKPMPQYHQAAVKVQKKVRGNFARAKLRRQIEKRMALEASRDWLRDRPGFAWLEREERKDDLQMGKGVPLKYSSRSFARRVVQQPVHARRSSLKQAVTDQLHEMCGIVYTRVVPTTVEGAAPSSMASLRRAALDRRVKTMSRLPAHLPPGLPEGDTQVRGAENDRI